MLHVHQQFILHFIHHLQALHYIKDAKTYGKVEHAVYME